LNYLIWLKPNFKRQRRELVQIKKRQNLTNIKIVLTGSRPKVGSGAKGDFRCHEIKQVTPDNFYLKPIDEIRYIIRCFRL
jgi:hypothetical protein